MNFLQQIYIAFVRIMSPTVLGVLIGVVTGLVINILTDKELLSLNKSATFIFSFSVVPLLVMIHVREDWGASVITKTDAGETNKVAWKNSVAPGFNTKNILYISSFLVLAGLIWCGIYMMASPAKSIDNFSLTAESEHMRQEVESLKRDTSQLRKQLREADKVYTDSCYQKEKPVIGSPKTEILQKKGH